MRATDYLRWASGHCARTSATAQGDLARLPDPVLSPPPHRHCTPWPLLEAPVLGGNVALFELDELYERRRLWNGSRGAAVFHARHLEMEAGESRQCLSSCCPEAGTGE